MWDFEGPHPPDQLSDAFSVVPDGTFFHFAAVVIEQADLMVFTAPMNTDKPPDSVSNRVLLSLLTKTSHPSPLYRRSMAQTLHWKSVRLMCAEVQFPERRLQRWASPRTLSEHWPGRSFGATRLTKV
jgi:hypothetical protein